MPVPLEFFEFVCIIGLTVSRCVKSIFKSVISYLEVALAALHSVTNWHEHALLAVVSVTVVKLRELSPRMVTKSEMSALMHNRVCNSLVGSGAVTNLPELSLKGPYSDIVHFLF